MQMLLLLRGKVAKVRFVFERPLLICKWQIAMRLHPTGEMLLCLAGTVWNDQLAVRSGQSRAHRSRIPRRTRLRLRRFRLRERPWLRLRLNAFDRSRLVWLNLGLSGL